MPLKHFFLWVLVSLSPTALTFCSALMALISLLLHTCSLWPKVDTAHPSAPGCHRTSLPCCHFCLCCQDKPSCMSQYNPHVQCKNQGTCVWFARVQRKYSHICCPTKGLFAWISLEVIQSDFSLQLRPWYSDPSQTFCGIDSCVMQKDLQ